ncbi:MAG: 3-deoxy-8-phosphooctulonate synthase [Candidatus Thermoplasmatota archaeon]
MPQKKTIDTHKQRIVEVKDIRIGGDNPLVLIAGPCVIEQDHTYRIAKKLTMITKKHKIPFIFKCSWDKANRTGIDGYRGLGVNYAIDLFKKIKKEFNIPILTDVHQPHEAKQFGEIVDILQVPAFLSQQTDMLIAAGKYGKAVNIKKGQFLSPFNMKKVIGKVESTGNRNILVTERGTCFGYDTLVVDMRSLVILRKFGYPIVFDATHSIRMENYPEYQKEFIIPLAKGAIAVGIDALFMEVHDKMDEALCDAKWMLELDKLKKFLEEIKI